MSERRVVITSLGAITPLGQSAESFWEGAKAGRSGVATIQAFDASDYASRIAGEVPDFVPASGFTKPKDARRADRYAQMAMAAAREAHVNGGLVEAQESLDLDRCGVLVGSGIGGLTSLSEQHTILMERGPSRVSPFMIPMMISNMASGIVAMEFGYRGPNFAVVTACATANQCIGEGWRLIRNDEADLVVAGGSEAAAVPLGMSGFAAMKALSTRNDEPEKASRPFDKDRDGFVLGEGAGIVVIEELEHAKKRGATILGEMTGYGISADAYHLTSPSPQGEGASRAMKLALKHAKLNPNQVDYANAHGTSTYMGDICETQAIKSTFGEHAKKMVVSSTKSMTGHLLGAAGAVELIACVNAIRDGVVAPTINLDNPDPECDLDYVPHTAREMPVRAAINNSFGFGGHNASIIVEKFE